jgi:ABC-type polar amino acid transport system ATPase subunit
VNTGAYPEPQHLAISTALAMDHPIATSFDEPTSALP